MDTLAMSAAPYPWHRLRSTRYEQIYVSPHMDDAVYSCGGQIALARAAGQQVLIITVFGDGAPDGTDSSGKGVFGDTAQRKREERAAVDLLDVDHLWLNYPDLLVRPKRLLELMRYGLPVTELAPDALQAGLLAALTALCLRLLAPEGQVFFPLAVGAHPDHRVVHAVGRAFAPQHAQRCKFYEDIPYAQVPGLRNDRLRQLGLARRDGLLASARQVNGFVFAHAPRWQRPWTFWLLTAHALCTRTLARLLSPSMSLLREPDLHELVIDAVIHQKVAAMRAYVTQTAFFFPEGDALYDVLARSDGHFVERYWTPAPFEHEPTLARAGASALQAELARADALVRTLSS
jgi:LmbE family N-acetylglucosaminyl deacetylase